jgi:ATP-dependent protease ClpP protease subunit
VVSHIYIYGEIGKQVTLDTVLKEITPKASEYIVHIHSPGGDVFEGYAIHNALKNTGKEIEVRIEGTCASIAMSIASVATNGRLFANTKSNLMVHNPTFQNISGGSKDLRNAAGLLDQIKSQFLKEWGTRTGLDQGQLSQMYDTETWMTPEQALELGFIDGVSDVLKAVAKADYQKYKHMKDKNTIIAFAQDFMKKVTSLLSEDKPEEKPKAAVLTLTDGTQINAPDEDWTGKPVTTADGAPLPPGDYTLEGGATFSVDENGNATSSPVEVEAKAEQDNDMKLKEENEALKARVAELESALTARNDAAAKLETDKVKLEAKAKGLEDALNVKVKALTDELNKFKETTVGDTTAPAKAINTPAASQQVIDPMQKFFQQVTQDRR